MKMIYYQFIYERNGHNKKEIVCGVRLYKSMEDFYKYHDKDVVVLKMIPHEIN